MEYISLCRKLLGDNDSLEKLSEEDGERILEFLDFCAKKYPTFNEFPLIDLSAPPGKGTILYIVGDIHGDLPTARTIMRNFYKVKEELLLNRKENWEVNLLFLGDYVDRAPKNVDNGGFLTFIYLLSAKMIHPKEIYLLRGNHEAIDLLTFAPYELPMEISDIFGEDTSEDIHEELIKIFSELPLFLKTSNGLIASHAGFPQDKHQPINGITKEDRQSILQVLWGDPVESNTNRGDISRSSKFGYKEVKRFLEDNDSHLFIRGHDYRTMGFGMYRGRLLTIHTSSRYKEKGAKGLHLVRAMVHSKKKIRGIKNIKFLHLEEGRLKSASIEDYQE